MPTSTTRPAGPTALMPLTTAGGAPLASTNASTWVERGDVVGSRVQHFGGAELQRPFPPCGHRVGDDDPAAPKARAVCAHITPIGPAPAIRTIEPGATAGLPHRGDRHRQRLEQRGRLIGHRVRDRVCDFGSMVTYRQNAPSIGGVAKNSHVRAQVVATDVHCLQRRQGYCGSIATR